MASLHKANLWNLTLTAVTYLDSDCLSNLNEIDGTQKKKNPLNSKRSRNMLSL